MAELTEAEHERILVVLREAFPDIARLEGAQRIDINKGGDWYLTLREKVRDYLERDLKIVSTSNLPADLRGLHDTGGMVFGITEKVYDAGGGGEVRYNEADMPGRYVSSIWLIDFNAGNERHNEIRRRLEDFTKVDTSTLNFVRN